LCNDVCNNYNDSSNIYMLCGKTSFDESLSIISNCSVFVSADSGMMHVASALNVKTISIFGPTSSNEISPYWNDSVVLSKHLSCSPCYPDLIQGCGSPVCMSTVTPKNVFYEIKKILE